jgi:hypothetical protein
MGQLGLGSSDMIAGLALVASLISLIASWRTAHQAARITTYTGATDLVLDIDHVFVEHPELRKYFYDGEDLSHATEDNRAKVEAIAELMLDCFEGIWDMKATYTPVDRDSWGQYILDMMSTSPVMDAMYEERAKEAWYPSLDGLKREREEGSLRAGTVPVLRWAVRLWRSLLPISKSATQPKREE